MRQYAQIKAKYPGALLLFRVGDFYETFGEDAIQTARILGITLTKRGNGSATEVELAGFPHHALDTYLPKLVRAGQRVAICDQLEDPKTTKTIVKRGVTELVTPGLAYSDKVLEARVNNYLAAVFQQNQSYGLAFLDISTGEFFCAQGNQDYADQLIQSLRPSEILIAKPDKKNLQNLLGEYHLFFALDDWIFTPDYSLQKLTNHFKTSGIKGFGLDGLPLATIAAGACLHYLEETQHHAVSHISSLSRLDQSQNVWLDRFTIRNLELISTAQENGTSLLDILDHSITPMGSRLLRRWILMPLKDLHPILERQTIVQHLMGNEQLYTTVENALKQIGDLERLVSKVALNKMNPREMQQLRKALEAMMPIKTALLHADDATLKTMGDQLHQCGLLIDKINQMLQDEPPPVLTKGEVIKKGYSDELDELRALSSSGKDYLIGVQKRESEKTGIGSLKIAYNNVFGYYLEVTNAHKEKVPNDWIRKQTLVNAERYITPELKEYEEKILGAEERIKALEHNLFESLCTFAIDYVDLIKQNAQVLSKIDVLHSFAHSAKKHQYVKPELTEGRELLIKDCRHPVIERLLKPGDAYVPNDLSLDGDERQMIILTGPNMSGKSAILRQTALAVLMAQMGSFVAASAAHIGLVDKIFTRVGASDNLSAGESTFMVEMTETASILNNLSPKALILLDEIGRGTSTYDGVSLAWSIAEYLHEHKCRPKTLFATHYHELNELEKHFSGIVNFHIQVKEADGQVLFLRKLVPGGSEHSFGIHVARMAGVPKEVLNRATAVLQELEAGRETLQNKKGKISAKPVQLQMFSMDNPKALQLLDKLKLLDVNTLSPIEALLRLSEWKKEFDQ